MSMDTRVYVMTHKNCAIPAEPGYERMQVGSALHDDLGYMRDDIEADNISDLNPYYAELTGLYSLWKQEIQLKNIGMCHYRRFFINGRKKVMSMQEFDDALNDADIIVAKAKRESIRVDNPAYKAVEDALKDYDICIREAWVQSCNTDYGTYGNLFVMHSDVLSDYCEWLFELLLKAGERIDFVNLDDYHKKCLAIVAEELLGVYISSHKLKSKECKAGLFDEKRETTELKQMLSYLIRENKENEAFELCQETLARRPDLIMPDSDIFGDLRNTYEELKRYNLR